MTHSTEPAEEPLSCDQVQSGGWDGRGGHTEERGGQARLCVLSPFGVLSLHAFSFHSFLNNRGGNAY